MFTEEDEKFFEKLREKTEEWLEKDQKETVELTRQEWHDLADEIQMLQRQAYNNYFNDFNKDLSMEIKDQINHPEQNLEILED